MKPIGQCIFLLIFITQAIVAQTSDRKHSVGIIINPNYLYKTGLFLTESRNDPSFSTKTYGMLGYALGFRYNYEISKAISIESGVQITQRGYGGIMYFDDAFIDPTSNTEGNLLKLESRSKVKYLDIPLFFKYQFNPEAQIRFHFKTGFSYNLLINNTRNYHRTYESGFSETEIQFFDFSEREHSGHKLSNFTFILSPGISYGISDHVKISIEPTIMHSLFPSFVSHDNVRYFEIGVTIGAFYNF